MGRRRWRGRQLLTCLWRERSNVAFSKHSAPPMTTTIKAVKNHQISLFIKRLNCSVLLSLWSRSRRTAARLRHHRLEQVGKEVRTARSHARCSTLLLLLEEVRVFDGLDLVFADSQLCQ